VLKNINSYNISKINILNLKKLDKSVVEDYTNSLIKKNYKSEEMLASIYNLYGSGYFDKINYNFQKNETDTDFNLNLYLVEKNYYSLNLGFYADEYYNAVGCLGISKNNIDKFGSKLDFETNFGLYKKIKLKYTTLNTTKLKLTSQITTSYIDSFIKLFNDSFFINNDYFRYKDISFNISKYVSFHSAFNISLNFSKFSSSLNQSTPYSKIELSFKYDNLKDYIFPANSSNFCIKYSKFLSHNYKNSEKLYLGTSYFPLIYRNTLLIINSGIGLSSHEINFIEKFTSGGPDEIPGYYRNEFRTDNLYFLTLGGVYKIREYKSLLKQKIYCSILSGIAEIKNNKNFSFDYNNLLYGITAKFILSTNFGNLEIIGGCNRKKQMHFYFQYGYKL
nr:hypothetical protein [Candidatus Dependentiae bacterium]